jgi:hypothetical protein
MSSTNPKSQTKSAARPLRPAGKRTALARRKRLRRPNKVHTGKDCKKRFFMSFDYVSDALSEIKLFFKRSHKIIIALAVQEILDEHIAKKLV